MRALFCAGKDRIQFGFDFASLEARINGHYVFNYTDGEKLAEALVAEKPNDLHCLDEVTEVLTKKGWKSYSELTKDTFVAQYNPETQIINYTLPKNIIINEEYQGEMIEVKGDRLDMLLTPNHRCLIKDDYTYKTVLANELFQFKDTCIVPVTGLLNGNADVFSYLFQHLVDHFYKLNNKNKVIKKPTGLVFRSFNKEDLEEIQKACLLNNVSTYIIEKINKGSYKNDPEAGKIIYQIFLSYTPKNLEGFHLKHTDINTVQYKGTVWCLEVPTNYIVCRRNGKVFITGNSINAQKLGIDRNAAKSFGYAIMFGAAPEKLAKMLGITIERAEDLYNQYWEAVLPLKELKTKVEKFWTKTGKQYILGLDGRHLNVRSKHSLINLLFQSGGAILCKWSLVNACERLEELGLLGDPFVDSYDALKIFLMIIYHDEAQFSVHPNLLKKHTFRADEKEISFFKKLKENISQYSEEKQKEIKNLKHPSYILAEEFKEELNSSCEISYNEDTYFFAEENILNKIIQDSIDKAVADLKLNVPLGISWVIGDNWKECH